MKSFPVNSGVQAIVLPVSDAADLCFALPDGVIEGVHYSTTATTGTPTTVTATLTDGDSLSVATELTQTAAAITDASISEDGIAIDSNAERALKVAITFDGGSTPHWTGSVTILFSPGPRAV